jgi:cell division protein ZapA (FtsZ GTPase activity inhibitor)
MEQELVGIQIQIAGKSYPLRVAVAETTTVRDVETQINDKINYLQKTYPHQDKDNYISMAFFAYAMDAQKNNADLSNSISAAPAPSAVQTQPVASIQNNLSDELTEKILQLDQYLDQLLA